MATQLQRGMGQDINIHLEINMSLLVVGLRYEQDL